ncbi:pyridoxamine 5'-phosphate oxidase family protein, partial [uncultured Gordonia sp.]
MYETPDELQELQTLLDASLSRSTDHLRSIISSENTVGAPQLVEILTGMRVLALSTVTSAGEPRISAVDGHFLHGKWVFGTARTAAKARHLAARPAASAAHIQGEELGVFTHGTVEILNPLDGDRADDW